MPWALVFGQSCLVWPGGQTCCVLHPTTQRHTEAILAQKLEGLDLYELVKIFAFYLNGKRFRVVTNHKPVAILMSAPQHNHRPLNWALKLSDFELRAEVPCARVLYVVVHVVHFFSLVCILCLLSIKLLPA